MDEARKADRTKIKCICQVCGWVGVRPLDAKSCPKCKSRKLKRALSGNGQEG